MGRLNGKVAIGTGAAQGMGASHVKRFVEEGAKVVFTEINQVSVFLGMKITAPSMIKAKKGSIVNISSMNGMVGGANGYTDTKFAVHGMTKAAALQLGQFGIRVNSVHPGVIETLTSERITFPGP